MPHALVVDDSKVDQRLVAALLCKRPDLTVTCAANGREALTAAAHRLPDVLLTDMQMPEMGGLELVEAIRSRHPTVPIIVMTAYGSEDAAAEALRRGATSYVPKKFLSRDLLETVDRVLGVAGVRAHALSTTQHLSSTECRFVVEHNPSHLDPLVRHVEQEVERMKLFDDTALMRLGIALSEALANAVNHGNLGVGSEMRETDLCGYGRLLDERRETLPYRERKVYVSAKVSRSDVVLVVRDEGAGFDPRHLPDPTDPLHLEKTSGRGMLLIRTFMDEVRHNEAGNEITMIKRKGQST